MERFLNHKITKVGINSMIKKKTYIKLSIFGKFVWTGLLVSWSLALSNFMFAILFLLFIGLAFSNKVYCEYKPESVNTNDIISITGRLSRKNYIIHLLSLIFVCFVCIYISTIWSFSGRALLFIEAIFEWNFCTLNIRRAQDCGLNSWVPIIPILGIILLFIPSEKKDNRYGPYIKN